MKKNFFIKITLLSLAFLATGCTNFEIETIRNDPLVYAPEPVPVKTDSILIETGKFFPQAIEIPIGTTVNFKNLDETRHLVISDPHPEHDQLPDLYSNYLIKNEEYSYTFKKAGTFGVHLEDNPSVSAKIIVR